MEFTNDTGFLAVFANLGDQVTDEEFHDWYDNEHVPLRTENIPEFQTAARYKALDGKEPRFVAVYTISSNLIFEKEAYTKLRAHRSPREANLVKRLAVLDRRIYKLHKTSLPSSHPSPTDEPSPLILLNSYTPIQRSGEFDALLTSAEQRYSKLPGYVRCRRFDVVEIVRSGLKVAPEPSQNSSSGTVLEVVEFDNLKALETTEFKSLEEWYEEALTPLTKVKEMRAWGLWKAYKPEAAIKAAASA